MEDMGAVANAMLNTVSSAVLGLGGLALVLLLIGLLVVRSWRAPSRDGRVLRREAAQCRARGQYLEAGRLLQTAGDHDQAIAMYTQAGAHRELGQLFEYLKHWDAAAQAYESANEVERAASMFQRLGDVQRAAELLKRAGKALAAGDLFEKAGQFTTAARLYEGAGHLKRAALLFERGEQWVKAAELFEADYAQEQQRWKERGQPQGQELLVQSALQAGRLWLKAGQPQRAAAIFSRQGLVVEAAEAFVEAGAGDKAAELYLRDGRYEKAALLFARLGDSTRRDAALAEARLETGAVREAADLLAAAHQYTRAAELYERSDAHERAAEMYAAAGDQKRAADLYLQAGCGESAARSLAQGGQPHAAAQLYVKLEKPDQAAAVYRDAGAWFEAGKIYRQMGRLDEALEVLQRLDAQSDGYADGSLILASIFMERGMLSAAKDRYQKVLTAIKDVPEAELEPLYQLARISEEEHDLEGAALLYEKVLARDFSYQDAKDRAARVRTIKPPPVPVVTPAGGPAPAPRYKILKQIGQGGMGVVYRAEDTVLHRVVAYKVLPASVKEQPALLQSFLQEARIAASINHPNIVTIYDTGHDPAGDVFISMEFVDGLSLKELLDKVGGLPLAQFLSIAKQICAGLAYAHGRRIIHRDIKPANIMLSRDRMVKIMDFGLAKIVNDALADKTSVKGTPLYMAPEQILGKEVDHQSDLYSLGCTLYRMATGRLPFTKGDLYYQHLHAAPQPPKDINSKLPDGINAIILRCLEKEKSKRYQQVGDVLADIDRIKLAA